MNNLSIEIEFYDFAQIKVNIIKYKILTDVKKEQNSFKQLTINNQSTSITTLKKRDGERILEIYINAKIYYHWFYDKINLYNTLKWKHITHNHSIYIINKVLIPRIEYFNQFTFFEFNTLEKLILPLKRLFKYNFHIIRYFLRFKA